VHADHTAFCFVWLSEQIEADSVYSAVRIESLYRTFTFQPEMVKPSKFEAYVK
jgi:hypothetical protein